MVVAEEFEQRAVELVASALDRHVYHGAGGIAKLGGAVAGKYLDFLQRIDRRRVAQPVVHGIVDIHTIEQEVVCLLAVAVDEGAAGEPRRGVRRTWVGLDGARH